MAIGVLSGFNFTMITTTAATLVHTGPCYIAARLAAGAAAAKLRIYDTNSATPLTSKVASILSASAANLTDETGVPIRLQTGCVVKMSVNSSTAMIYVR
jgi:adenosylmethionine-8-amino-7-oxononanoate aminotransferase